MSADSRQRTSPVSQASRAHTNADDLFIKWAAGLPKCFSVGQGQQGIVVEHFLKIGEQPVIIDGIAGKFSPHVVG